LASGYRWTLSETGLYRPRPRHIQEPSGAARSGGRLRWSSCAAVSFEVHVSSLHVHCACVSLFCPLCKSRTRTRRPSRQQTCRLWSYWCRNSTSHTADNYVAASWLFDRHHAVRTMPARCALASLCACGSPSTALAVRVRYVAACSNQARRGAGGHVRDCGNGFVPGAPAT
jgi:hypothetical protein